jgi:hypothetical protein
MKKFIVILLALLFIAPFAMADFKIGISGNFEFTTNSQLQSLQSGDLTKLIRPGIYLELYDPMGFGIDLTAVTTLPDSSNNIVWFATIDPTFHFLNLKIIDLSIFAGLGVTGENATDFSKINAAAWFFQIGGGPSLLLGPLFVQARAAVRFQIGNGQLGSIAPLSFDDIELALIAGLKL